MRDKELRRMLANLFTPNDRLILTQAQSPRTAPVHWLKSMTDAWDSSRISVTSNAEQALTEALNVTSGNNVVCVTGSLYLLGEAFRILKAPRFEAYNSYQRDIA